LAGSLRFLLLDWVKTRLSQLALGLKKASGVSAMQNARGANAIWHAISIYIKLMA